MKQEAEEKAKVSASPLGATTTKPLSPPPSSSSSSSSVRKVAQKEKEGPSKEDQEMMERLGLGFGRLQAPSSATGGSSRSNKAKEPREECKEARERFASSKSISSDQYFNRGDHDEALQAERAEKVKQFSGATAISSAAYFGREDEEDDEGGAGRECA